METSLRAEWNGLPGVNKILLYFHFTNDDSNNAGLVDMA